jgi:hypothetical protein
LTRRRVASPHQRLFPSTVGLVRNVKRPILVLGAAGFIVMADNWIAGAFAAGVRRPTATDKA